MAKSRMNHNNTFTKFGMIILKHHFVNFKTIIVHSCFLKKVLTTNDMKKMCASPSI